MQACTYGFFPSPLLHSGSGPQIRGWTPRAGVRRAWLWVLGGAEWMAGSPPAAQTYGSCLLPAKDVNRSGGAAELGTVSCMWGGAMELERHRSAPMSPRAMKPCPVLTDTCWAPTTMAVWVLAWGPRERPRWPHAPLRWPNWFLLLFYHATSYPGHFAGQRGLWWADMGGQSLLQRKGFFLEQNTLNSTVPTAERKRWVVAEGGKGKIFHTSYSPTIKLLKNNLRRG